MIKSNPVAAKSDINTPIPNPNIPLEKTPAEPTPPSQGTKSPKKNIVVMAILFIFLVIGIGLFLFNTQQPAPKPIPAQKIEEQAEVIPDKEKVKLAYTYRFGILTDSEDPRYGVIYISNADGSDEKALISFEKTELDEIGLHSKISYLPQTDEILVNTEIALYAIKVSDGSKRTIYDEKVNYYHLSADRKWAFIGDDKKINLSTLEMIDADKCNMKTPIITSSDSTIDIVINEEIDETVEGIPPNIISGINICNKETQTMKEISYDNIGSLVPQFIDGNYLYFIIEECCVSLSSLSGLQQINLETGEAGDATNLSGIMSYLFGENNNLYYLPNGHNDDHYLFQLNQNKDSIALVDHQISLNQERIIAEFDYSQSAGWIEIYSWSSDGSYVVFEFNDELINIYNFETQELESYELTDDGYVGYVILK